MTDDRSEATSLAALLATGAPCVAVSFTDDVAEPTPTDTAACGMDVAELRIDRFASTAPDHVVEVARRFDGIPTIATIRSTDEGGDWSGDDEQRLALFHAVLPHVDAVDIELSSASIIDAVIEATHDAGRLAIVSHHDFSSTPTTEQLWDLLGRATAWKADVFKIAAMVRSGEDLRRLAAFTIDRHDRHIVVIGMGPLGVPSRISFPFLGSSMTFASAGVRSAPGQLDLDQAASFLRALSPAYAARHPAG